jgi:hypothetical protein
MINNRAPGAGSGQNGNYLSELEAPQSVNKRGPEGRPHTMAGSWPILILGRPQGVRPRSLNSDQCASPNLPKVRRKHPVPSQECFDGRKASADTAKGYFWKVGETTYISSIATAAARAFKSALPEGWQIASAIAAGAAAYTAASGAVARNIARQKYEDIIYLPSLETAQSDCKKLADSAVVSQ